DFLLPGGRQPVCLRIRNPWARGAFFPFLALVSFPPAGIACCFPDFAFHHAPVPVFVVSVQQCCFLSLLSMSDVSRCPEKSLLAAFFLFFRAMRSLKTLRIRMAVL
ncbi:MAG: hypothetical protein SOT81_09265, partial [Treponema sp.]|nr:hypothetical protein [Treponema sp.]